MESACNTISIDALHFVIDVSRFMSVSSSCHYCQLLFHQFVYVVDWTCSSESRQSEEWERERKGNMGIHYYRHHHRRRQVITTLFSGINLTIFFPIHPSIQHAPYCIRQHPLRIFHSLSPENAFLQLQPTIFIDEKCSTKSGKSRNKQFLIARIDISTLSSIAVW